METARQILRNTGLMAVANLTTRLGSLLLTYFIARQLNASGLGTYSTATTYYALLTLVGAMGVDSFLVREIARDYSRTSEYVAHATVLGLVVSIITMGICFAGLPLLGYSDNLTTGLQLIIAAIIPGTLNIIQTAVFVAHQRMEYVLYTRLLATVLMVFGSLVLLLKDYSVISLLAAFVLLEYAVMLFFFIIINRKIARLKLRISLQFMRQLVLDIKEFAGLSLLSGFFVGPEVIIISLVWSEETVGFYTAANKLVTIWYMISQILMTNVYPALSRSYKEDEQRFQAIQDTSIKFLAGISLPIASGLIAVADTVVILFYGDTFRAVVVPLQILALNIPLAFIGAVQWRVLAACDLQSSVLKVRLITTVTRLLSSYILIRTMAAPGAAISVVLNLFLNLILLAIYSARGGIKSNLIALSWRSTVAAFGMGAIVWFLNQWISIILVIPIAIAIYCILIFVTGGIDKNDLFDARRLVASFSLFK